MSEHTSDSGAQTPWIKTNQGMAVCTSAAVGVLLIYLLSSDWVYEKLRDGFHLGTFSVVSGITMLICTVSMIFDSEKDKTDEEMAALTWRDWGVAFVSVVACFVYFQLAWSFDFLVVSPFFLCAGMYLLGVRPLRSAITSSVIMTVAIYGIFRLIGISLPSVIIPF
ncbi:MAG: tripartite tricarboxylate transporter TctB family protein [Rhodospirillales bacterium]